MGRATITEEKIIQITMENFRSFYNRNPEITIAPMTEDFMWIGSNDFQWCENSKEFNKLTKKECEEPPVLLSDEEYHLLFHERNVWVVYGRCKKTVILDDGTVLHAHVRFTYVWHMIDGELKLAHIHSSHAQDIPINRILPQPEPFNEHSDFFEYMKKMDSGRTDREKITFRDREKNFRCLFPTDILYIKAAGQWSDVYTKTDNFQVWGLLSEYEKNMPGLFKRIHKSYLVNSLYIDSIHRYKAVLRDGRELPIGKERYMDLKRYLQKGYEPET